MTVEPFFVILGVGYALALTLIILVGQYRREENTRPRYDLGETKYRIDLEPGKDGWWCWALNSRTGRGAGSASPHLPEAFGEILKEIVTEEAREGPA